jgi:hypothetical protein
VCRWRATYHWKALDKGYNKISGIWLNWEKDFISIGGLHTKLCAPKVVRASIGTNWHLGAGLGLPLGSLGTKWHLGPGLMDKHKVYYKGRVVASLKFGPWWILWVHVCLWFVRAPKCSNYALTNLLFGLFGLCGWLYCLSIFLIPSQSSSMPLYPQSATS